MANVKPQPKTAHTWLKKVDEGDKLPPMSKGAATASSASSGIRKVSLEIGGKDPNTIVPGAKGLSDFIIGASVPQPEVSPGSQLSSRVFDGASIPGFAPPPRGPTTRW